jgi:hypothetical protein
LRNKRSLEQQFQVVERSSLTSTGSKDKLPLAIDGWQVVGASPLSFEQQMLPAPAGLKLEGGVIGIGENNRDILTLLRKVLP